MDPIPVVCVVADKEEWLDAVEELAGEDVIEEFGPLVILEFTGYWWAPDVIDELVTLLADLSNTDIRLLGLNFGVSLNGTTIKNSLCLSDFLDFISS